MISRVLIVDDEPLARERLSSLVRDVAPAAELREASHGDEAVELISAWSPQVLLLDIQMPERSGMEVVEAIGVDRMPLTIFITAYDTYAVQAFSLAAVDYLLKPFDTERFLEAWHRVAQRITAGEVVAQARAMSQLLASSADSRASASGVRDTANLASASNTTESAPAPHARRAYVDRMVVKQDQRTIVVMLADVQWIESDGNYVVLHAGKERHQIRETLNSVESRLDPRRFVRIHRRTIVDLRAMKELQPWFGGDQVMILRDGARLRVSRSYRTVLARRMAGEL